MTRQEKLDAIYKDIPCWFGLPGHSVCSHTRCMIGDVLDGWDDYNLHEENYPVWFNTVIELIELWKIPREPIDSQSDDCIDYVYSLIHEYKNWQDIIGY